MNLLSSCFLSYFALLFFFISKVEMWYWDQKRASKCISFMAQWTALTLACRHRCTIAAPEHHTVTWGHTPSTTSTTTMAPSHRRTAVDTSLEKSTCPGESIRFTRYSSLSKKDKGKSVIIKGRGKICYNDQFNTCW